MSNGDEKEINVKQDEVEEKESESAGAEVKSSDLENELEKYKKMAEENYKHFQYSVAEMENFKKRVLQDRGEYRRYGIIPFVREILHVVDNLERALEHLDNADKESLTQGIQMTLTQFNKSLEQFGVTAIPTEGKSFDPAVHEAISMVQASEHEPNMIIDVLQKGYILDDRLIRPSQVTVSDPSLKKETLENEENNETPNEEA